MKIAIRILLALSSGVAALGAALVGGNVLVFVLDLPFWAVFSVALLAAAGVAWYVWTHTASFPDNFAHSCLLGGVVVGGIGFSLVAFEPLLSSSSGGANLSPLVGMVTGALGCILGAACGGISWYVRQSRGVAS